MRLDLNGVSFVIETEKAKTLPVVLRKFDLTVGVDTYGAQIAAPLCYEEWQTLKAFLEAAERRIKGDECQAQS